MEVATLPAILAQATCLEKLSNEIEKVILEKLLRSLKTSFKVKEFCTIEKQWKSRKRDKQPVDTKLLRHMDNC